jgi:hypothetical protein
MVFDEFASEVNPLYKNAKKILKGVTDLINLSITLYDIT